MTYTTMAVVGVLVGIALDRWLGRRSGEDRA